MSKVHLFFAVCISLVLLVACTSAPASTPTIIVPTLTYTTEATSTPKPSNTPNSTPTPLPSKTPTPTIKFTNTPSQEGTPTPIGLLFSDDFSDPNSGWKFEKFENVNFLYTKGTYHINITEGGSGHASIWRDIYRDVRIEADIQIVGEKEPGYYGALVCRYKDIDNYYLFTITPDGAYSISKMLDGKLVLLSGSKFIKNSNINEGELVNHVGAECDGNHLRLFVNDVFIAETVDSSFTSGKVGMWAGVREGSVDVIYDNFEVFSLTKESAPTESTNPPSLEETPTPIGLLFSDDFSDSNSGWHTSTSTGGSAKYKDGTFRIEIIADEIVKFSTPGLFFTDVRVEVDAELINGNEVNDFGVICRYYDIDNFYTFEITSVGNYAIRKRYKGGEIDSLTGSWKSNSNIKKGKEINHIAAECAGDKLRFFVNGYLLAEIQDEDISAGDIGLIAGVLEAPTEILFDNFKVYSIP